VTKIGNYVRRRKECVSKLNEVKREFSRRAHQINLQTQGEISRWLSSLKRKVVWEKTQFTVIEYSEALYQEGIKLV
jgi:hypothetical protein